MVASRVSQKENAKILIYQVQCTIMINITERRYEHNMMICTYDDNLSRGYDLFIIFLGIGLPICVTVVCYWRLFA